MLFSLNYIYQTGRPYVTFVRVYPDQGKRDILQSPRSDDTRFDGWSLLDFRVQKTFNLNKTVRLDVIFDIFNVFNANTTTSYQDYRLWMNTYLQPSFISYPRWLQLGLKLQF